MDAGMYLWKLSGGNWGIATKTFDQASAPEPPDTVLEMVSNATVGTANKIVPSWFSVTYGGDLTNVGPLILRATDDTNVMINIPSVSNYTIPFFVKFGVKFINTFSAGLGVELYSAGIISKAYTVTATMGYYLIPV